MVLITPIGDNLEAGSRIHWDAETQNLYYVDVLQSTICRHKPSTGEIKKAKVGDEPLAFAFPVEGKDDHFIAGLGRKIVLLRWDGNSPSVCTCNVVTEVDRQPELCGNRLNGANTDSCGRLWFGTMGPKDKSGAIIPGRGCLYSLDQGRLKRHLKDVGISSGLAFDLHLNKMYYVDTLFPGIYEFNYDEKTGEISDRRVVFQFEEGFEGAPDGLTVDGSGDLWLAVIFGSKILKIDPQTGTIKRKIEMPTSQITSITFAGGDLRTLYVTSARMDVDGKVPEPPAGSTFKIEHFGKSKGVLNFRYVIK